MLLLKTTSPNIALPLGQVGKKFEENTSTTRE
jgi:hypothetical protein